MNSHFLVVRELSIQPVYIHNIIQKKALKLEYKINKNFFISPLTSIEKINMTKS